MQKAKLKTRDVFCAGIFIFPLFITDLWAIGEQQYKQIKDLEAAEQAAPVEIIKRTEVQYKAEGFRDPFKDYIPRQEKSPEAKEGIIPETPEPLSSLTIQGIIWGGRFPQAIINNKVVKEGDTIEGVRIISIDKSGVKGIFSGRQYNFSSPAAEMAPSQKPQGGKDEKHF